MSDKLRIDSNSQSQSVQHAEPKKSNCFSKVWQCITSCCCCCRKGAEKVDLVSEEVMERQDSLYKEEDAPPLSNRSIFVSSLPKEKEYSEEEIDAVFKYAKTGDLEALTKLGEAEPGLLKKAVFTKEAIFGNTPLLWAIANAKNPTAQWIIETYPSCINEKSDNFGNYPIHLVLQKGYGKEDAGIQRDCGKVDNHDLLRSLIKSGANVNVRDAQGDTPLHIAYARRDFKAVELLLQYGADPNITNEKGQKPEDLSSMSYPDAVKFLEGKGGKLNSTFTLKEEAFS